MLFINISSLLIVLVGSFMVVMMKFGLEQFLGAVKVAVIAFIFKIEKPSDLICKATELASESRKKGLLALENMEVENKFFKKGIQYLVDGIAPEIVKATLIKEMNQTVERHEVGQKIFKAIADVGSAMGMIGTFLINQPIAPMCHCVMVNIGCHTLTNYANYGSPTSQNNNLSHTKFKIYYIFLKKELTV